MNQESACKAIRTFYYLSKDAKFYRFSVNWNYNSTVIKSLSLLEPALGIVESKIVNSLIVSLNMLGIYSNPIWKSLEEQFLKSTHESLETNLIPIVITAFSNAKCTNKNLWTLLNQKMKKEYLKNYDLTLKNAILTYKSFSLMNKGSPELMELFKSKIMINVKEINPSFMTEMLECLVREVVYDRELAVVLINRTVEILNHFDVNLLCLILVNFHILKEGAGNIERIEAKILQNIEKISMKSISNMVYTYTRPTSKSSKDRLKFSYQIFEYYLNMRDTLKSKVNNPDSIAAYDYRIVGAGIELGFKFPDEFCIKIFKEIKQSNLNRNQDEPSYLLYLNFEKYVRFLSINKS
jgi:hypothetical protein